MTRVGFREGLVTRFGHQGFPETSRQIEISGADRDRVSYRLQVTNPDGTSLLEQRAYFGVESNRISWLRIMCSGFRAIDGEQTNI